MATLTPYLFFGGRAAEAMNYYKNIFGGNLQMQKVSESPVKDSFSPEMQDKVLHAMLEAPGVKIFASDLVDGSSEKQGNRVELCLVCESKEELETLWAKLLEGGTVVMEKKEEFFGTFGGLTDKYGIDWMVQYSSPELNAKLEEDFKKA